MKPILYSKFETQFNSNGIGVLNVNECIVEEERNGTYEARFTISKNEKYAMDIEHLSLIKIKVSDTTQQIFRVYKIENEVDDMRSVYCEHISYKLKDIPVIPFQASAADTALNGLKTNSVITNPFTFHTNVSRNGTFKMMRPMSCRECMGGTEDSILDIFHGEYKFDNFDVSLLNARGGDYGVTLRYGKNLTDFSNELDTEDTVTGILPYWSNGEEALIGDITYSVSQMLPLQRIVVEDVSNEFNDVKGAPARASVTEAGRKKLQEKSYAGILRDTIRVSFVNLADTEEYKNIAPLESVLLCDMVTVIYEPFNFTAKMKVTKTTWNALEERYDSIELGDARPNLVTELARQETDLEKAIRLLNDSRGEIKKRFEVVEDGLELEVSTRTEADEELSARIELKIANDDDGEELISMINMYADKIHFTANKVFQVDAPNWSVDADGDMYVIGTLYGKRYNDDYSPVVALIQFDSNSGNVRYNGNEIYIDTEAHLPGIRCVFEKSSISPPDKTYSAVEILEQDGYTDGNAFLVNAIYSKFKNSAHFESGALFDDTVYFGTTRADMTRGTVIGKNVHTPKLQINDIGTTTSPANIHISESEGIDPDTELPTGNYLQKVQSGSSQRYKNSITDKLSDDVNPHKLYELPVKQFKYNKDYLSSDDVRYDKDVIGFIAEDMDKIYPQACEYNHEGKPEAWNEHYIIPAMMKLIQEQNERIKELEKEVFKDAVQS